MIVLSKTNMQTCVTDLFTLFTYIDLFTYIEL